MSEKIDEMMQTAGTSVETADHTAAENAPTVDAAAELAALRAELAEQERIRGEEALLADLFPDVKRSELPEAVEREATEGHMPLAAAYALYLRRRELASAEGQVAARLAAAESAGALTGDCGEPLYSIEEIRSMSRKEIRRSYKAILRSLERSNH